LHITEEFPDFISGGMAKKATRNVLKNSS